MAFLLYLLSYLLGSIPFALIIGKGVYGVDAPLRK